MIKPIRLYVSSSPDLSAEREAIARVVAALPLAIGWQIGHTPLPGQLGGAGVVTVQECDLYAVLLGHDFSAPMGQELRVARSLSRVPFAAYRYDFTLSPSAQDALRTLDLDWKRVSSTGGCFVSARFEAMFRRDLLEALLEQATTLGLKLGEVRRLLDEAREGDAGREDRTADRVDRRRDEAGRSGRILGREVWEAGA